MMLTLLHSLRKVVGANGTRASLATLFSRDHYESVRMQCRELTRNELDLVLLGQISALLSSDLDTNAKKPFPRKRSNMAFYHGGVRICRITFQKLHGIGTIPVNTCMHTTYMHTHTHKGQPTSPLQAEFL